MRYGENPHQRAAFYRDEAPAAGTIATYRQLQGKELSYNNVADADAAWECVKTFAERRALRDRQAREPLRRRARRDAARRLPRGVRHRSDVRVRRHHRVQPRVDAATLEAVAAQFLEVLIAPAYTDDALAAIARKANVRVLEVALPRADAQQRSFDLKRVGGGFLVQTRRRAQRRAGRASRS